MKSKEEEGIGNDGKEWLWIVRYVCGKIGMLGHSKWSTQLNIGSIK
jgi:hypothetical protein